MKVFGYLIAAAALGGCADSEQEALHGWMAGQRDRVKPEAPLIAEPGAFMPQPYTGSDATEPFDARKLTQVLRRDAPRPGGPELDRRKEALEAFPLDAMTLVGSLRSGGQTVALISVDQRLYQVRAGHRLGLHEGRVTRIGETELVLRETVQDAAGEWTERLATLRLQEKTK
jgi:type IV pilus assembly protein PilP